MTLRKIEFSANSLPELLSLVRDMSYSDPRQVILTLKMERKNSLYSWLATLWVSSGEIESHYEQQLLQKYGLYTSSTDQ